MRTTVNLPDSLAEAVKARAAAEGRTVTSLIEEGLRLVMASTPPSATRELPAFGDPGGRFLVDITDRDAVWAALDADGLR
ncbi:ribbon-helix-helix protein, CopG family [Pseudonocardia sp. CA-107938]|uniref:ribbon-helix-helix protein, CopG family n=1 Tax=Pseudonocardia sp. CA-107938 TaxID=3240021 RepID=UPI003D8AB535